MVFHEHIIQVSAPGGITREALWAGLERFARNPKGYVEGIASCAVCDETCEIDGTVHFVRQVIFETGAGFEEVVTLRPNESVHAAFAGTQGTPGSSLLMRIEEPEAGSLFLRCVYEQDEEHPAVAAQPHLAGLVRQAYEAKDRDVVRRILAEAEAADA